MNSEVIWIILKNEHSFIIWSLVVKVLVTGAAGLVGKNVIRETAAAGHRVRAFDVSTRRTRNIARGMKTGVQWCFGDLRNIADVCEAVKGMDCVIHLGAIIPSLADIRPELAEYINVEGTENIIRAIKKKSPKCSLIFTSSIAVYGDRIRQPLISRSDSLNPSPGDEYARQKIVCEAMVRESGIKWSIFRLTYITSPDKLKMDPIMFEMPLVTSIEICHASDAALALAHGVSEHRIWGKVFNIAGGEKCRTTYKDYLEQMMKLFGLGSDFLREEAFSSNPFHCGHMITRESEKILQYQRHTLQDYYELVKKRCKLRRFILTLIRPVARWYLLISSPYFTHKKGARLVPHLGS